MSFEENKYTHDLTFVIDENSEEYKKRAFERRKALLEGNAMIVNSITGEVIAEIEIKLKDNAST